MTRPTFLPDALTCSFLSGEVPRRRSVSPTVHSALLDIPTPPAKLRADWAREIDLHLQLPAGDVEALPWVRTRARWPEHKQCIQAVAQWTRLLGLDEVLADSDIALMACRGARQHHDAEQYGGSAFCNLFLTEDQGLDLLFPATGQRIALARGTAVIFDTGQPHTVVQRGSEQFNAAHFEQDPACAQVFLTWELPIDHPGVCKALQISFDLDEGTHVSMGKPRG